MFRRLLPPLLATLAIAALATGCGGDDGARDSGASSSNSTSGSTDNNGSDDTNASDSSSSPITTSSLTKVEFTQQANTICDEGKAKMVREFQASQLGKERANPSDLGVEAARTILLPGIEAQIADIRELGAPSGDEDQIEAYLAALQRAVEIVDERELSENNEVGDVFTPAGKLALKYGIDACAYGY